MAWHENGDILSLLNTDILNNLGTRCSNNRPEQLELLEGRHTTITTASGGLCNHCIAF
jgi:hypothetical protein